MKRIIQLFIDIFFPKICEGCGEKGSNICKKCAEEKIEFYSYQMCHVCKKPIVSALVHKECRSKSVLDGVFVVAKYNEFLESYLGDIKYEFYYAMMEDLLKVTIDKLQHSQLFKEIVNKSVITFVPLHPLRRRWRGFNQAELIAQNIARHWKRPCIKLLNRNKKTRTQVGLKRKQRLKNLKDAFELCSRFKSGDLNQQVYSKKFRSAIIIDDVMTSGSTLEECAKVLKDAGYGKVFGLVIARG